MEQKEEDLKLIDDIGEKSGASIVKYFADQKNIELINNLKSVDVNMIYLGNDNINEENFFYNKRCVITGSFDEFDRKELTDLLESKGAKCSSSVSKNTNYLIMGENPGSKLEKAKQFNVKIITESELKDILKEE